MLVVPTMAQVMQSFVGFVLPGSWQTPMESHAIVGPVPVVAETIVTEVTVVVALEAVVAPVALAVDDALDALDPVEVACVVELVEVAPPLPPGVPVTLFAHATAPVLATKSAAMSFEFIPTFKDRPLRACSERTSLANVASARAEAGVSPQGLATTAFSACQSSVTD
jgi:hypothetical protein